MNAKKTKELGCTALVLASLRDFFRATRETHKIMLTVGKKLVIISWFCTITNAVLEIACIGAFGYGLQAYTNDMQASKDVSVKLLVLSLIHI